MVSNTDCTLPGMFGLKSNAPKPANPGAYPTSMTGVDPGLMSLKNIGSAIKPSRVVNRCAFIDIGCHVEALRAEGGQRHVESAWT